MSSARTRAVIIIAISVVIFIFQLAIYLCNADPSFENLSRIITSAKSGWKVWANQAIYYPPLWSFFVYLLTTIFGTSYVATCAANAALIILSAIFVYYLSKNQGAEPGFASLGFALTVLQLPALSLSLTVAPEPILSFSAIAFIYFLIKSDNFSSIKHAALAGLFLSIGLLTKWSFFGYAFLPALIVALTGSEKPIKKGLGLIVFALMCLILAGPWYLFVMDIDRILPTATNDPSLPVYSFLGMAKLNSSLLISSLFGKFLGIVVLTIIALALVLKRTKTLFVLASSIVSAIIFFSIPSHTEQRYLWPLAPVISCAAAISLSGLTEKLKRKGIVLIASFVLVLINLTYIWHSTLAAANYDMQNVITRFGNPPKNTYCNFHKFLARSAAHTKEAHPVIGSFPPLNVLGLGLNYTENIKAILKEPWPHKLFCFGLSDYLEFHNKLRALELDFIIMDCQAWTDCAIPFQNFLKTERYNIRTPFFGPGMTENESQILDPKMIVEDFAFITANYRPVESYEIIREHILTMWVKKQ